MTSPLPSCAHGRRRPRLDGRLYERQPDKRVVDNVVENGRVTKIEVRHVPEDLQREADPPPTEAGGRPQDEAYMTEREKKLRLQAGARQTTEDGQQKFIDAPKSASWSAGHKPRNRNHLEMITQEPRQKWRGFWWAHERGDVAGWVRSRAYPSGNGVSRRSKS